MILALVYPLVLGLDRLETAAFLRSNGTFQYLTGLQSFPDPQTLRRFLVQAPESLWKEMHILNDRLLQHFIHLPDHRSRLIFDLDSTVVTVFGHQEQAAVGYNPRYRGKRSYNPLLCIEANSILSANVLLAHLCENMSGCQCQCEYHYRFQLLHEYFFCGRDPMVCRSVPTLQLKVNFKARVCM